MPKDDRARLRHMLDASAKAVALLEARERSALDEDEVLALAIVRLLEIVGEAASQVTPETRRRLADVPWRQVVGMRNILIHGYADLNLDVVWETIREDLPGLLAALKKEFPKA